MGISHGHGQRSKAGLRRAVANGKKLGRPRVSVDVDRIVCLRVQGRAWAEIARELGVGKGTAQRAFRARPLKPSGIDRCKWLIWWRGGGWIGTVQKQTIDEVLHAMGTLLFDSGALFC